MCLFAWASCLTCQQIAASLGYFTTFLAWLVVAASVVLAMMTITQLIDQLRHDQHSTLAFSLAVAFMGSTLLLWAVRYIHPTERMLGGNDQGLYACTAVHLAATGRYDIPVPWLAQVPSEFRKILFRCEPAAAVRNTDLTQEAPRLHIGLFF